MIPNNIHIATYDYDLPDEMIAKFPLAQRDACKLLVVDGKSEVTEDVFSQLPKILPSDSILIYNNTRVINARLRFAKDTGAIIEIFCLEPDEPADYALNFASNTECSWVCLVGNSKRWKDGDLKGVVRIGDVSVVLTATRLSKADNASVVRFSWDNPDFSFARIIEAAGEIPIPPYLNRKSCASDNADYQTVYSHIEGSVAAPTAGLHFTPEVLEAISQRGIPRRELTLHVGAGTFRPVKSDDIAEHEMHSEYIAVERSLIAELASTTRRVIAVGTTSVRTLESLYHIGCLMYQKRWDGEVPQWYPYENSHPELTVEQALNEILTYLDSKSLNTLIASTRIIIAPGYTYRIVSGMVTNFHQPKSTLLLLVSAFIGERWRNVYDYALSHNFRFLSYGDACLFLR